MHIENIRTVEEILAEKIKAQFEQGIECIDVCEMAQAADMLKDLAAAEYHSRICIAMQTADTEENDSRRGYKEPNYHSDPFYQMSIDDYREWEKNRDMDRYRGKMYFSEPILKSKYDRTRRAYTESKEIHKGNTPEDKQAKMKDLEEFMRTVADDISEILNNSTLEEKNLAKTKIQTMAQKIV